MELVEGKHVLQAFTEELEESFRKLENWIWKGYLRLSSF